MYYLLYSSNKISQRKENVAKKIIRKHVYGTVVFIYKNPYVSGAVQFTTVLCDLAVLSELEEMLPRHKG